MIKINLLPVRARKKKEDIRQQALVYVVCVALVVGACGYLYAKNTSTMKSLDSKIKKIEAEIKKHKKTQEDIKRLEAQEAEVRKKLDAIKNLKALRGRLVHMLDELATRIPKDKMWFDSVNESGGSITITGVALSHLVIADFMRDLAESPWIDNQSVNLVSAKQHKESGVKLRKFTITCKLTIPKKDEPEKKT